MLGKFITEERIRLGLTQQQAADKWGMSRAELSMIEAGHRTDPRGNTLLKLSRGLGVTVDRLLK